MASDFLGTYDPKEVTLKIGVLQITGFADGTFIKVTKTDKELYKIHTGAYGETSRTKNNNKTGKITFTLKSTSPSNWKLDLLKNNPVAQPIFLKNNSTAKYVMTSSEAWINTDPDKEFAAEESMIEWEVFCADMLGSHLVEV